MIKQLSRTFIAGAIAISSLLLLPLTLPDAFRAESFEACQPSGNGEFTGKHISFIIRAHNNLKGYSPYVDVYWVSFFGKRDFLKRLFPGQFLVRNDPVGQRYVAQTSDGSSCEYFTAQQSPPSYNIGEYID